MSRELIVIAKPNVSLTNLNARTISFNNRESDSSLSILASEQVQIQPLFEVEQIQPTSSLAVENYVELPDLSKYYKVNAPDGNLEELVEQIRNHELVEDAYIKPAAELARLAVEPVADVAPPATPDFSIRQGYLEAAPVGIDARYAWNFPGGKGNGINVIDIEGAWRFSHEDLQVNQGGVIDGIPSSDIGWRNHGTAVVGVISGDENSLGITGISPDAKIHAISIFGENQTTSTAILKAANTLDPGDIILIELHRPGPRFNFQERVDQKGYIAIEWWQDDFDAIRFATAKGVIVVEAAGNGAENLDEEIYENKFNRSQRDSGAIIVGAGAPPPGTHGRDHGPDRSRLEFSNYGAIVDAQGWGREVTTTGYIDLQGGVNEEVWYTDQFSGTSSASPIVVGTLTCLQGIIKSRGQVPLKPVRARDLLRNSGSPQQDAPTRPRTQRIGNRPDLKQLTDMILKEVSINNDWESLGGNLDSAPTVVAWESNRLDCFAKGPDNHMYHKWWDGHAWHDWEDLWGDLDSAPTVVAWGPNRLDCFAKSPDNHMYHKWWDSHAWHDWEDLGGNLVSDPTVVAWESNRLDCFAKGSDNHMYHKWWDGHAWHDWEDLGGDLDSAPTVVAWGPNRLDCFAKGPDNHMYHKWWDGHAWHDWEDLGGNLVSDPTVIAWESNRLDCFAKGPDNHMYHKWWDGHAWHDWEDLGGNLVSAPTVAAWGPNRLDCFAKGPDNHMYHKWWDGHAWHDWEDLGGHLVSAPTVVAWGPNRLDCFAKGPDNHMYHKWWNGLRWSGMD
ncbi:S8 family serine peptidase [Cytobacillus firmus]|uniref:S8 family serine peptidase n=1 Tax=Cytobacillus firmus TaxID=1399 RepID=UPI002030A7D8|nr:S8 family serine peptidase [Cytobacillus firmus]URT71211.1 S8 family serine peptidase [Cytobacillus firmus]